MKTATIISLVCLIITIAAPTHAMDAEMLSSENKAVTGEIVIKMDPSVNAKSVHLVDSSDGTKIWIDVFKNMSGAFKNFVAEAAKSGKPVIVTGTFEKWSDGNTVLNPRKKIDFKMAETGSAPSSSCTCTMCY